MSQAAGDLQIQVSQELQGTLKLKAMYNVNLSLANIEVPQC